MIEIRKMTESDIPGILAIEQESFISAWPDGSFEFELRENKTARYIVAQDGELIVGYIGAWFIMDECHITTMAVHPQYRRQHIGTRLLKELLTQVRDDGCRWTVLEVRESNTAAQGLYKSFGFKQIGLRKQYYEDDDNAVVMWLGHMQQASFEEFLKQCV